MAQTKKNNISASSHAPTSPIFAAVILVLLLCGLGSSIYLTDLYFKIQAVGSDVQSFCAINQSFNCVTVATSKYSVFLGIPISLYGVEYFSLAILLVLLGTLVKKLPLGRWDSLLFIASVCSLPACAILAYISATQIKSFCLLCCTVYAVHVLLALLTLIRGRNDLRGLFLDGPRGLLSLFSSVKQALLPLLLALGLLSQFFWLPGILRAELNIDENSLTEVGTAHEWHGMAVAGQTIGPPSAPIKIEEFTDFQCPFCGRAHQVMMEVLRRFPNQIHLIHRDYPMDNACNPQIRQAMHPQACNAAYYARCAAQQGRYWPYEALLFPNRDRLDEETLPHIGKRLRLDEDKLKECAKRQDTREAVQRDIQEAISRNIEGTPTYFVNGEAVVGLKPLAFWETKISSLLKGGK